MVLSFNQLFKLGFEPGSPSPLAEAFSPVPPNVFIFIEQSNGEPTLYRLKQQRDSGKLYVQDKFDVGQKTIEEVLSSALNQEISRNSSIDKPGQNEIYMDQTKVQQIHDTLPKTNPFAEHLGFRTLSYVIGDSQLGSDGEPTAFDPLPFKYNANIIGWLKNSFDTRDNDPIFICKMNLGLQKRAHGYVSPGDDERDVTFEPIIYIGINDI